MQDAVMCMSHFVQCIDLILYFIWRDNCWYWLGGGGMKRILLIADNSVWSQSVMAFAQVVSSRLYFSDRAKQYDAVLINAVSMSAETITGLVEAYAKSHVFLMGAEELRDRYKGEVLSCFVAGTSLRQVISIISLALSPESDASKEERDFLSDKEKLVLRFMSDGFSDREISQRSLMPLSSVKYHLRNSYEKLGVRNRVQAALKLQDISL